MNYNHVDDPILFVRSNSCNITNKKVSKPPKTCDDLESVNGEEISSFYADIVGLNSKKSELEYHSRDKDNVKKARNVSLKRYLKSKNIKCPHSSPEDKSSDEQSHIQNEDCFSLYKSHFLRSHYSKKTDDDAISLKDVNEFLKASRNNDIALVRKCLNNGIDINSTDSFGWTALMCSSYEGKFEMVEFLLASGANPLLYECRGNTAYDLAVHSRNEGTLLLLEKFISGNQVKENNSSPSPTEFKCRTCDMVVKNAAIDQHNTSTLHLFNSKISPNISPFFLSESNPGYKMMKRLGWNETGLGPDKKGRINPIKTVLRNDRKCLGAKSNYSTKVTHFDPFSESAVKNRAPCRKPRLNTCNKVKSKKQKHKDINNEIWFRRQFNS